MTIEELQGHVDEIRELKGWAAHPPETIVVYLAEELGEVARCVRTLLRLERTGDTEETRRQLGHELYDVAWNLCALAQEMNIDPVAAFREKHRLNLAR